MGAAEPKFRRRKRRTKPPRTGANPRWTQIRWTQIHWTQSPLDKVRAKRPHMKTLSDNPRALRPEPIRLGHMTNSLFTLQSTTPPGVPRTVSQIFSKRRCFQTRCFREAVLSGVARATPAGPQLWRDRGGGERVRTDDLLLAKQALSQLSYTPLPELTGHHTEIRSVV